MTDDHRLGQDPQFIAVRKKRSLMIAFGLIAFVSIIYFVTMVRMAESVKAKQAAEMTQTASSQMKSETKG